MGATDGNRNQNDPEMKMARKRSSGFLETLFKSVLGVGTTVHYDTDWLGRRQKVVKHHDSGKTKTYTHSDGFLFGGTTTRTTQGGREIERGRVRKGFFGGATEQAVRADGTRVERTYSPGLFRDHVTTTASGTCFACDGTGEKHLSCRVCDGVGSVHLPARPCFSCDGMGKRRGNDCPKCQGTGTFKPACDATCRRCEGAGEIIVTCKRCEGSGVYYRKTHD